MNVEAGELHAFGAELVDIRSRDVLRSVTVKVTVSLIVCQDENDVGWFGRKNARRNKHEAKRRQYGREQSSSDGISTGSRGTEGRLRKSHGLPSKVSR